MRLQRTSAVGLFVLTHVGFQDTGVLAVKVLDIGGFTAQAIPETFSPNPYNPKLEARAQRCKIRFAGPLHDCIPGF